MIKDNSKIKFTAGDKSHTIQYQTLKRDYSGISFVQKEVRGIEKYAPRHKSPFVKLINHSIQNGLTMYWEEIRIKGLNKIDSNLPKTKSELVFEDRFLDKIEQGVKTLTIRNSPVELGLYELRDGLVVEVYGVKKFNYEIFLYGITLFGIPHIEYEKLGFEKSKDGEAFYRDYLKYNFCYLIEFEAVNEN